MTMSSGLDNFVFMKSTQSGWENYYTDKYSTLQPTGDRICATSMVASWKWSGTPADYAATNAKILEALLREFATTYSPSVQNSLYRMGGRRWLQCRRFPRSVWLARTCISSR